LREITFFSANSFHAKHPSASATGR